MIEALAAESLRPEIDCDFRIRAGFRDAPVMLSWLCVAREGGRWSWQHPGGRMCPERLGIQLQLPQRAVALSAASLTGRMPGRPALLRALAKLSAHSWHVSATHMSLVCALL